MNTRCAGFIGVVALLFFACTDDSTGPTRVNPPVDDSTGVDTTGNDTTHTDTSHTDTTRNPIFLEILGPRTAIVGQSVPLWVKEKDSSGLLSGVPIGIVWSSSDSTLIQVSNTGILKALRIGTAIITATVGSLQDTLLFTSYLPPYTFVFADTVSASERQLIRDGIQYAHALHQTELGRVIQDSTTVSGVFSAPGCGSGGSAAYTGAGTVVFCLGNPGWKNNGPVRKQKIVQHELFHVWQFENKWLGNPATAGATWLIEGSAEWMGYKGVAARGLLSFETALGCQIKESADFATRTPPGLPALSSVETQSAFQTTVGPLYTHSMLGADYLIGTTGPLPLKAYADAIKAGTQWQTAFQTAFGKTTTDFYAQFPSWLSAKPVPANYLCGI
jgi:hypothetical protein